ncbi:metal-sulfur cluster assembly factor [Acidipropionibacterium acidipropionici]|jgi:metal-sulfur cluster biosynthetic enzyme|uniref:metal-sulfur cluster assembly factor n=1 Tax=Acidipropionibacterium acidipropionici TaxID=1748 RepID=UPI001F19DCDB|nr:metal-sulfur cluster assembly factor [Acidipropionibacterium acidipropionici]
MSEETTEGVRPSDLVRDTLPDQEPAAPAETVVSLPTVDDVVEAMKDVIDPELMVNVVDLGLVYGIQIDDDANVTIDMTLTSPTCPLTDRLEYDTQTVLEGIVNSVAINWVWLPPWGLERITPDGRQQLQAIGFNV